MTTFSGPGLRAILGGVRTVTLTILVSLATAAPALAQDEGITIDPDSPSAKEYAIPLERERRQADPAGEADARIEQGTRSSPLFGEGIESTEGGNGEGTAATVGGTAGRGDESGTSGSRGGGGTERDRARSSRPPVRGTGAAAVLRATTNPGAPTGGVDTALIIGGVAAAVLALGGGAGLLLRRRS
jgi:hypothetical protein